MLLTWVLLQIALQSMPDYSILYPWWPNRRKINWISQGNNNFNNKIVKKTAGCMKAAISDADNFSLVFPKKATKEIRAVLMAAVIMLDFMFFEEGPANNSR